LSKVAGDPACGRLRELDPEHLLHDSAKRGPGGTGPLRLTPLQSLDRLAALVPPPRVHCASQAPLRHSRRRTEALDVPCLK